MAAKANLERQELDVSTSLVVGGAVLLFAIVYIVLLPIQDSNIGDLFYRRGFTQFVAVFLACFVIIITLLKFIKLQQEYRSLNLAWIPNNFSLDNAQSQQVAKLQYGLARNGYLLPLRCSRILKAYIESGNSQTATEIALDDSSFYASASESSYSVPRILVWAIPLLGFIGTVIGISQAVSGFSGFLEEAGEIDQIKEGIGTVTSGLAVAFDTTLLALLLSVLVMIPLVLVERFESRLLLAIDVYINENLLAKLPHKGAAINPNTIRQAVIEAVESKLPDSEALIQPAREYAEKAATEIAQVFVSEISRIQETSTKILQKIDKINQVALKDRQNFAQTWETQQQHSQMLIQEIQNTLSAINQDRSAIAGQLEAQSSHISQQLEQATLALSNRVEALEKCSQQVLEVAQLQANLEQSFKELQKTAQLDRVLKDIDSNLAQLQPVLQQLGKPRRIMLVEGDE
ncbi:MAG: MotA/TolQ/ExbB proton channel family protein [Jaaginema sp. PMC 1079.18]|nr:MotA/TolQ/ExbB proton channel family protein [Jaaginema sp. PMC 1080.18]MEC4852985.1 MotA/TolQ/ExbB proton channel family protein [Jaaginema sp. PMC 1079.18]MEC4865966.1 MotA/TolQ/ExbB proton channel family protein [Jaaginema sp. PMC 1078.18]